MKLRTKVLMTLVPMTLLYILVFYAVGVNMLNDQATINDKAQGEGAAQRIGVGLSNMEYILNIKCKDYSYWDDTWEYFVDLNDTYTDNNLNAATLYNYEVDAVLLYDNTSTLVYSVSVDGSDPEDPKEADVASGLLDVIGDDDIIIYDLENETSGVLAYDGGSAIFSACPVLRSDGSGPINGKMIMITYLNEDVEASLSETFGNHLTIEVGTEVMELSSDEGSDVLNIENINDSTMLCSWSISDINGVPAALMNLEVTRDWHLQNQRTSMFLLHTIITTATINFILIMVFVDRSVLSRMHILTDDIFKIGKGQSKEKRVRTLGNDEITDLGVQVNAMLESLDRSEQELVMKERRYRALVEGSSNAIILVDSTDLSIIEVNPAFLKMTGRNDFDLKRVKITDVLDAPWEWDASKAIVEGGRVQEGEGRLIHSNQSVLDVELSMTPLTFDGKEGYFIIGRDLTERRRAEKERERILDELSRTNENLEVTLKSIADGVISVDQNDGVVLMNRAAEDLIGVNRRYGVGKNIRELVPLPDREWDDYRTLRQAGPFRVAMHNNSGQTWQMEYSYITLTSDKGEVMGKMFTFRDISEKARAEIAEANAGRLEAIGTLAGGIAHDFNNVMTSVVGELYLLRTEIENSEGSMQRSRERIYDMEMAMDRAKFVAQELLSLSKGGAPIQKPTTLRGLLEDTARLAFTGSSITWSLDCPDDIWPVNIDQGQMNRAFLNILFNAQEASREKGSVEIVVRNVFSRPGPDTEGRYVNVNFIDHGEGIPPDVLPRIFDPYYTTKATGTGLGMTVTFTTIKRHGGTIEVTSEVNKGTKVSVYLPATEGEVTESPRTDKPVTGTGRVLIMDDEEFILQVTTDILESLGYEVDVAHDGEEALERYGQAMKEGRKFDVVIMDLTIPGGMGGKETIGQLLRMDRQARAIVSSGYSNDPVMADYEDFGFVGVVPKPYKIEELSLVVKNAMLLGPSDNPEPDRFK